MLRLVVIDDPIISLDEHRSLTTVQEMRHLAARPAQVIVLSRDKLYLCRIWDATDRDQRTALEIAHDGAGSTIRVSAHQQLRELCNSLNTRTGSTITRQS